jgi:transposase InsO family protein
MRFRQIEDHREVWPVRVMCDALSVSPSGYYAWRSRPQSPRKIANCALLGDIQRIHAHHRGRYGAPRILATGEGWLYLAVILDLFTRKVVGWAMRDHMRAELTIAALTMAIQRRRPGPGLIHHSDRGSQYAAGDYRDALQAVAIIQSMSRKGNCWDNAPMESFFGTLKTELVHRREYPDRDAARRDLFAYIEGYYNRQRIHSAIGYITPDQAEAKSA